MDAPSRRKGSGWGWGAQEQVCPSSMAFWRHDLRPAHARAHRHTHYDSLSWLRGRGGGGRGHVWQGEDGGRGWTAPHPLSYPLSVSVLSGNDVTTCRARGRLPPRRPRVAASCTPGNLPSLALAGSSQSLAVCHSISCFRFSIKHFPLFLLSQESL